MRLNRYNLEDMEKMERWDAFVVAHPDGTPFHRPCWLSALKETYSFEPLLYVCTDEMSEEIAGLFPVFLIRSLLTGTRAVSLPFSDYCGPLCNGVLQKEEMVTRVLGDLGSHISYFEIRDDVSPCIGFSRHNIYKRHVLKLTADTGEIIKKIDKRTIHYSIRKAKKAGVEIVDGSNRHGMEEFYRLNRLTRKKHGMPVQPKAFFNKINDHIISRGNGFILLALHEGEAIASALFLTCGDTVYYKYGASNPEFLTEKCPNHMLTLNAIERASLAGYKNFDFGRTSADDEGLIRYKEMWGALSHDLSYYYYPQVKGATAKEGEGKPYRLFTGIWRRLPNAITDLVGPMFYRHLG